MPDFPILAFFIFSYLYMCNVSDNAASNENTRRNDTLIKFVSPNIILPCTSHTKLRMFIRKDAINSTIKNEYIKYNLYFVSLNTTNMLCPTALSLFREPWTLHS